MGLSLPLIQTADVTLFVLVLARVAGIFSAIPLFGGRRVPVPIRIATVFAMALVFYPIIRGGGPAVPKDVISLTMIILGEVLLGLCLGLLVQVVFAAVELCGQLVGTQMGLSVANLFDPTFGQIPLLAMFQNLLAMLLFVSLGIHHVFIRAIVDSYTLLPVGSWHMSKGLMQFIIATTSGLFVLAIKLAAPVMVALLMATVVLGVMARSFPQMNIFMISFPLNIGIGFVVLGLSLLAFSSTLQAAFGAMTIQMQTLFRLLA